MTILAILTKFCLKFANLVNFAMSFFLHGDIDNFGDIANIATFASAFFCFALSALSALSPSKVQIVQIVQCHFLMNQPNLEPSGVPENFNFGGERRQWSFFPLLGIPQILICGKRRKHNHYICCRAT